MEAVDAIFEAFEELDAPSFSKLPSRMLGDESQPAAFVDFTSHEIEQAERFLIRCGLLRRAPRSRESR